MDKGIYRRKLTKTCHRTWNVPSLGQVFDIFNPQPENFVNRAALVVK